MKNITLNIVFLMTLFTFIGCDNLPIQPEIDDSTNYSITPNTLNGEETMSEVVPQSNDFIVNKSEIPLDTILICFNLTPDQKIMIDEYITWYKNVQEYVKEGKPREIYFRKLQWDSHIKSLNLKPTDSNYKKEMNYWIKLYNYDIKKIEKNYSDSLRIYKNITYNRIRMKLNPDQILMWDKWVKNPKLPCEFLKP